MSPTLIAFVASGLGIVLLLGLKSVQERYGVLIFWPDVRAKSEKFLARRAEAIRRATGGLNRRTLYVVLHFVLSKLRTFVLFVQGIIDRRLLRLVNLIKGRHMPDSAGRRASHFLHDIAHFRDRFKN